MFNVGSYNNEDEAIQAGLDDTYLKPSVGEVFKANVRDGFDMSTTGVAWNWANEKYLNTQGKQLTQDEWRDSPFYRDGIKFEDGWSSYRAEHMAQVYDERQVDKKIMDKSSGFFQGAVGLAGQFAGAAIDPTNFIPFAGGVSKGASLGMKVAKGAAEGAIGNLAVSAVARPYWENKGDQEAGFSDYAMDTVIGGLFGGGLAGLGHAYGKWRDKPIPQTTQKTINEASDSVVKALDKGGIEDLDHSVLNKAFSETNTIDAQIRSERVKTIELEVSRITGDETYAKNAALTIDSFAETMGEELGITADEFMNEFGFTTQASEMVGRKNDPRFLKRPVGEAEIEVSKMIDSEVDTLMREIESAQAGEKLFVEGEYQGSTKSTFPEWFREAGFKSKKEFLDAAKNKNSSKYDTIRTLAEDRLKASGDPEYAAYTGFGMDEIPTNEMGEPLFQASSNSKDKWKELNEAKWPAFEVSSKEDLIYAKSGSENYVVANIKDGNAKISTSQVSEDLRGSGFGSELYRNVVDEALNRGLVVKSDETVEIGAVRVYNSLKKHGYKVETNPKAKEIPGSGGGLYAPRGESVFTITQKETYFKKSKSGEARGAYEPSNASVNGQRVPDFIHLMENADKSTFLHESAHWMLETTKRIIDSGRGSDRIKADYEIITKWASEQKKLSDNPNIQVHETFAQGYEAYLREGKAPTRELQGAFERFSQWLKEIYSRVTDLDVKLNDDIRGVYDRLFQNDAQKMRELEAELTPKKFEVKAERMMESEAVNPKTIDDLINEKSSLLEEGELENLNNELAPYLKEKQELDAVNAYFQGAKTAEELAEELGISNKKFDELIKEFEGKLSKEDAALRAQELEKHIAAEKKKLMHSLVARERFVQDLDSMIKEIEDSGAEVFDVLSVKTGMRRKATAEDAILAMIEGNNSLRGIKGAGNSIATNTQGAYNGMIGELNRKIAELGKNSNMDLFKYIQDSVSGKAGPAHGDLKFHDLIYLEMASIKKDGSFGKIEGIPDEIRNGPEFKQAKEVALVLKDLAEKNRKTLNNLGADIGELEGWTPRSHNVEKMAGKKSEWMAFMREHLNLEETFGDARTDWEIDKAIEELYFDFTTGIRNKNKGKNAPNIVTPLPKNRAKKLSESRKLFFKDPMSELLYSKEYGTHNNIIEAMNASYGNSAREIALIERLGPSPETTLIHATRLQKEKLKNVDTPEARKLIEALNENKVISRESSIGSALMYALGESSENTNLRKYGAIVRAWNSLTMLGSSTLSQVADFSHAFNERRMLEGENTLTAWTGVIKDYVSKNKDGQEIANYMGVIIDGMLADNMNRFDVANDFKTNIDGLNNTLFKIIGVDWHTKKMKKGAMTMYAKELADNLDRSWDEIHPQMKERLVQYAGFDQKKWDFIKKLERIELGDNKLVTAEAIDELDLSAFEEFIPQEYRGEIPMDISNKDKAAAAWEVNKQYELQKAKTNLTNYFRSYFIESIKNNVLEPDARTKRLMFGKHKAGTPAGEALRLMTQFKTFTTLYMDRSLGGKRYQVDASDSFGKYQFMASSLILGYTAMTLKDLAKGHEPKDPTLPQSWVQAGFQSGGLGIFGDFIQGAMGRNSASLLETLAGPTASRVGALTHVGGKVAVEAYKAAKGEKANWEGVTSDVIDQGKTMIPFNNVFYTRAIADYLIWHNIKETLEPGSIRRNEKRLKKEFNQKYIVSPREFQWMN